MCHADEMLYIGEAVPFRTGECHVSTPSTFSSLNAGECWDIPRLGIGSWTSESPQLDPLRLPLAELSEANVNFCSESESDRDLNHQHTCFECYDTFSRARDLEIHSKRTGHKTYRCSHVGCGKSYARRDVYARHVSTHNPAVHRCTVCPKVFKRKDNLSAHLRNMHSNDCQSDSRGLVVQIHSVDLGRCS